MKKNRFFWVLAVIILLAAVVVLSPKTARADDENPTVTFSIDFGAGHEAFVQEYFGGREDVSISGSVVSITAPSGEYSPEELVYQIMGLEYIAKIDNGQSFMNEYGIEPRENYASEEAFNISQSDYYYAYLEENMTLYAFWADPLTDVTITVIPPECGTEVKYEFKTGIYVWATPQPNLSITGPCYFEDYQLFYNSWDLKEYGCSSVDDDAVVMTGGNSYKATGYIGANWGYYIPANFADTLKVTGGELVSVGGTDWPSNHFVISVPVEHFVPEDAVTVEPTCTKKGSRTYTCPGCNQEVVEVIEATGHTEGEAVKENVIEATCEEPGSYDEVVYCTVCGDELSRRTVKTEALGHDWGEWGPMATEYVNDPHGGVSRVTIYLRTCRHDSSHIESKTEEELISQGDDNIIPIEQTATYSPISTEAIKYKKNDDSAKKQIDEGKGKLSITIKGSVDDKKTFSKFKKLNLYKKNIFEREFIKTLERDKHYTARSGSLIIDLYDDFLNTLEAGEYILEVEFEDGSCDIDLVIEEADKEAEVTTEATTAEVTTEKTTEATTSQPADVSKTTNPTSTVASPRTGDETLIGMWIAIMAFSLIGVAWTLHIKRVLDDYRF